MTTLHKHVRKSNRFTVSRRIAGRAACCAASLLAVQSASAALTPTNNWIAGGSGSWAEATNWSEGVVPSITGVDAHDVYFNAVDNNTPITETITIPTGMSPAASAGRLNFYNPGTTTLTGAAISLRSGLVFASTAGPVTIASTGAAALNLNGTSQSYINNSSSNVTIAAGSSTPNSGQSITLTLDGVGTNVTMTGHITNGATSTVAVKKTGAGTWQLEGNSSSFSGGLLVEQGTLLLRGNNTAGTGTLTMTGGTFAGIVSARSYSFPVIINGDVGLSGGGVGTSFTGSISLGSSIRTINAGVGNAIWLGAASDTGGTGGIDKYGVGNLTMNAAHTFGGGVIVHEGAYQIANDSVVMLDGTGIQSGPLGRGTLTLADGGTFRTNSTTGRTVQNNLSMSGNVTLGPIPPNTQTGSLTFNSTDGVTALATPSTVTLTAATNAAVYNTTTFANNLVGASNLTKSGDGTLILSADNSATYTGTTFVTGGKLAMRQVNALGSSGGASDYTQVSSGAVAAFNNAAATGTSNEAFRISGDGFSDNNTGALTVEASANVTLAGPITLTGNATIHVTSSAHAEFTNTNAITAEGDYTLTLQGGANNTLGNGTVSGAISLGAGGLTKLQGSIWVLAGALNYTGPTNVGAGRLVLQSNPPVGTAYNVTGGILELGAGGSRILDTSSANFSVSGTGKVDVQDNKVIVRNGDVAALTAQIASGRNGGGWDGTTGIITTQADAAPGVRLTSLGIATAEQAKGITGAQTATFGGQTVNPTDALIMYTYTGDADLNGEINGDDYVQIDSGFSAQTSGWYNGDFNYSGNIDADDYFLIDSNYGKQSLGIIPSNAPIADGVTAVPEPASVATLAFAGALLLRRRRN